jgi:hypothetical protein
VFDNTSRTWRPIFEIPKRLQAVTTGSNGAGLKPLFGSAGIDLGGY